MNSIKPFEIKTPESMTSQDVVDLFVDVFTDFKQLTETGHSFICGSRGSGKSMIFRYMLPDCQMIAEKKTFTELDFIAINIPIKLTDINTADLDRLKEHADILINEHILTAFVFVKFIAYLSEQLKTELDENTEDIKSFYEDEFKWRVKLSGYKEDVIPPNKLIGSDYFKAIMRTVEFLKSDCLKYCYNIAINNEITSYKGALFSFIDFLLPLIKAIKNLNFFPKNKPVYLLFDDAGYLNETQTKILNNWVSYRTTLDICIKISHQNDYKTYHTTNSKRIDTPHDYTEINISNIYTNSSDKYYKCIKQIVEKRIDKYLKKKIDAKDFFPSNLEQESKIQEFYDKLKEQYHNPEKNYAGGDAARRYSRPEYIKSLHKNMKTDNYSYSGFDQLVTISSGVIRDFLEPANQMFSDLVDSLSYEEIGFIPHTTQNKIIRNYSENFLFDEFAKNINDTFNCSCQETFIKLVNLINSLGEMFHNRLISEHSERRVFSVALKTLPDKELSDVLNLAIHCGYLQKSSIGNKKGTGKLILYILSRRLAPLYKLDPTSFAGYIYLRSDILRLACNNPDAFAKTTKSISDEKFNKGQDSLFSEEDLDDME